MHPFHHIKKLKELYSRGENMMAFLRAQLAHPRAGLVGAQSPTLEGTGREANNNTATASPAETNSLEAILASYDIQSGMYTRNYANASPAREAYGQAVADILNTLPPAATLLEVGVGEATTLAPALSHLAYQPAHILGLDLAWSRLAFARSFLRRKGCNVTLFTGNMFTPPLGEDSIDLIFTAHAVEPNGGREAEALAALYRIAKHHLVLIEPGYEWASPAARARMQAMGYATGLRRAADQLGYKVLHHGPFSHSLRAENPSSVLIIEKSPALPRSPAERASVPAPHFTCPYTGDPLLAHGDSFLATKTGLTYPVLDGIPCLLQQNAILATHLHTDTDAEMIRYGL